MAPTLKHGIPEPWASALTDAGFVSPWNTPSMNRLSEATGVHVSTISRIIKGQNLKGPTHQVITTLASALGLPPRTLGGWIDAAWAEHEPYEPPAVADFMTAEQRACVDQIIRAFATTNRAQAEAQRQMDELSATMEVARPAQRAQSKKST